MTKQLRDAAQALINCPHCDSEALIVPAKFDGATGVWFRAWCKGCGASQMPRYAEPVFAAAAWNRRTALAAPEPAANERLERLLSDVEMYGHAHAVETRNDAFRGHESMAGRPQYDLPAMFAEIEQSARALLGAAQEDAEMLDWLDGKHIAMFRNDDGMTCLSSEARQILKWAPSLREAIREAMKETK